MKILCIVVIVMAGKIGYLSGEIYMMTKEIRNHESFASAVHRSDVWIANLNAADNYCHQNMDIPFDYVDVNTNETHDFITCQINESSDDKRFTFAMDDPENPLPYPDQEEAILAN